MILSSTTITTTANEAYWIAALDALEELEGRTGELRAMPIKEYSRVVDGFVCLNDEYGAIARYDIEKGLAY